jgi:hypothetical protein
LGLAEVAVILRRQGEVMVPEVAFLEHSVFGRSQAKGDKGREVVRGKMAQRSARALELRLVAMEAAQVPVAQVA